MASNPMCAVDECNAWGVIELTFPDTHERGGAMFNRKAPTFICEYHAMAAQEIFASMGVSVPIDVTPRRTVFGPGGGERRRYPKFKPHDNSDYDRPYGS